MFTILRLAFKRECFMYLKSGLFVLVLTFFMIGSSSARMSLPFGYAYVASGSMEPTFPTYSLVFYRKLSPTETINRGDIVLFASPHGFNLRDRPEYSALACKAEQFLPFMRDQHYAVKCGLWVKRIVGLPRNTVTVLDNCKVKIDGNDQDDTYFDDSSQQCKELKFVKIRSYKLNEMEYFALGDNRTNSADSRTWGGLPRSEIFAKVVYSFSLPFNFSKH
jgi:signal peptidase I